ncbi:tRNA (uracil(54)-C(5))-methyltransferase homolog-B isoform X2 [Kryptolebias marmoratus]|uniref:tRNA (uracil(54)-C(5))-methyltransferase n=1 Tax=Kryptolebias marmoratus TaxID=37003 RepID=A0A3Q3B3K7_KRYMA|nr:tRNA (uracil(54)-C(5))-methyltransferase homolog-B isoform X2 [Kryptolebias marmoratus]
MTLVATRCRSVTSVKQNILFPLRRPCLLFSAPSSSVSADRAPSKNRWRRKSPRKPPWDDGGVSWEERLADQVTPLWRLSYEQQLQVKLQHQDRIMSQLSLRLSEDFLSPSSSSSSSSSPNAGKPSFPVLPVLPSPVRDGYRNKSTFSVNKGVDGNPKTVGFYIGTGREGSIVCVNADHLLNMPEKHKLVARCYQDFIRRSPLDPCLLFHTGGHWREVTVRTNARGHTMVMVYFHPQTLSPDEVAVHKAELVEYFTQGPGSVCEVDSLFFQESCMTRCTHEESPYQLLHGQPYIYEEVLGFKFRISADAFFQVNQAAAEVLYGTVRDLCLPNTERGEGRAQSGGTLLDVCCGTGAIGIALSPRVDRIIGIELIEQAVRDAVHNAALNDVSNCEFIPGKAEAVLPGLMSRLSSAGGGLTAVVNPSRAGLHHKVVRALRNQAAIRRLVYVSCKPDGEAMRNFRELCCAPDPQKKLTGDAFSPTLAVPVDMFPHTSHCELVLLFER